MRRRYGYIMDSGIILGNANLVSHHHFQPDGFSSMQITSLSCHPRIYDFIFTKLSMQSFALSATVQPEFQCQTMPLPKYDPSPAWGVKMDLGGRKWYHTKCHLNIHIRLLYTLQAYLAPFGFVYNTQNSRQTEQSDRNRPPLSQHRRPNSCRQLDFLVVRYQTSHQLCINM